MTRVLAATNNRHKVEEMRAILAPCEVTLQTLAEAGLVIEVDEDQPTFVGNAVKKALAVAAAAGCPTVADDSGLEVLALGGEPGVYSARYAGAAGDAVANNSKLLARLGDGAARRARFVCVIAVARPHGLVGTAEGEVWGQILREPRGSHGFGYDPLFVPDGFSESFAELPAATKNGLSHRGRALRAAVAAGLFRGLA
jgi:XTP/dITP diphosphohydrolase